MTERLVADVAGFTIAAKQERDHFVEFSVYEITGEDGDGFLYLNETPDRGRRETSQLHLAQKFMSGSVKWDGCSNWRLDDQPVHFCGGNPGERLKALFDAIWKIANELMPMDES